MDAEGGLHAQVPRRRSRAHWQLIGGVTADSDERRHLRSAFRWCARSDEHCGQSEHNAGDDRRHTHAKRRHFRKILRREMAQHGAEDPDQHHAHDHPAGNREPTPAQRFPAHEPHHLLWRRAEAAQHAVKFCTLSNARVQARGDHEHTGDEHQHAEHDRCEIDLHHRRARALSVEAEELHVFHDLIVGKIHVRFEIADRLPREKRMRKLHIEPAVHIVEVDVRKRLRIHLLRFGVHLAEALRRQKGAEPIGRHCLRAVLTEAADGARDPAAIRRSDRHRLADLHAVDIPRVLRQHDVVCAVRELSIVDGVRDDLCHHRFVTASDEDRLAKKRVRRVLLVRNDTVARHRGNIRTRSDERRFVVAHIQHADVENAVVLFRLRDLRANVHIRHAEDRRHEKHREHNADDRHAVLAATHFCGEGNKLKIIFHCASSPDL